MYKSLRLAAALGALAVAGACSSTSPGVGHDPHVEVAAAFYPLQYVTEQVGGDHVHVENLVKPGAEPHDLELSPQQMVRLSDAGLVVYLAGFQPNVDQAVATQAKDHALDVASVVQQLGNKDPHIWLDPTRLATVADAVAARLGKADAGHAAEFTKNAAALRKKLTTLDGEYRTGLANCASRSIVTSHEAFGYLADRYKLRQVGITGLNPDSEPTGARLAEVAKIAKAEKAKVIFFETLVSPKIAETLASEVGARAEKLDPLEGLEAGSKGDYISVMRSNLTALRSALGCR
jgi:zinc transport system substrate-binding protein